MKRQETFELTEWGRSLNGLTAIIGTWRDVKNQFYTKEPALERIAMSWLTSSLKHGSKSLKENKMVK